jgi:hypothetical protein
MKLVSVYHVARDEKFLAELVEEDLTLTALKFVIEDRGKGFVVPQLILSSNTCFLAAIGNQVHRIDI